MPHTLDVLELIVQAIFTKEKAGLLDAANLKLEVLRVLWRLVRKRGWISLRQLYLAQEKIDESGRGRSFVGISRLRRGGRNDLLPL